MSETSESRSAEDKRKLLAKLLLARKKNSASDQDGIGFLISMIDFGKSNPQNMALSQGNERIDFGTLLEKSNQVAHLLSQENCDNLVLDCSPGIGWSIVVLGALKAGKSLIFAKETSPSAESPASNPNLVVNSATLPALLKKASLESTTTFESRSDLDRTLYHYSPTGTGSFPVPFRQFDRRVARLQKQFILTQDDTWAFSSFHNEERILLELLWPLSQGASVAFIETDPERNPEKCLEEFRAQQVSAMYLHQEQLVALIDCQSDKPLSSVRFTLTLGENPSYSWVKKYSRKISGKIFQLFSHPEAGGELGWNEIKDDGLNVDTREFFPLTGGLQILDRNDEPLGPGMKGRLVGKPLFETGSSFTLSALAWKKHTGALVRGDIYPRFAWLKGHFVECGRVETALLSIDKIRECWVFPRQNKAQKTILVAYIVTQSRLDESVILDVLEKRLPGEMIPSVFIPVSSLIRNEKGDIDFERLIKVPSLNEEVASRLQSQFFNLSGVNEVESLIAAKSPEPKPYHVSDILDNQSLPSFEAPAGSEQETGDLARLTHENQPSISIGPKLVIDDNLPIDLQSALSMTAVNYPNHGVTFVEKDYTKHFFRYSEMLEAAQSILGGLKARGQKPGDILLFQFDSGQDFIPAFWACLMGGFVCLPVSVPAFFTRDNNLVLRIKNSWELCNRPPIFTTAKLLDDLKLLETEAEMPGLEVFALDPLRDHEPDNDWHKVQPEDKVLLLLTSGSTGIPKAVIMTHGQIVARYQALAQLEMLGSKDVAMNWLPLDHVAGVVMYHMASVWSGSSQLVVEKEVILEAPLRLLDLIDEYRVSHTLLPNFAFGLINTLAEEIENRNWDLSCLRHLVNAGEHVVRKTNVKFLDILQDHGMSPKGLVPAWGMSETSSATTYDLGFHQTLDQPLTAPMASGVPIPGFSLRIVDDHGNVVPEGTTGSLEVKGEAVTPGYYQNPEKNREVFTQDGWFVTGDYAYILDGNLTLTGRSKDIIINGINFQSSEIEALVEEVPGVLPSFTVALAVREENQDTDQTAILFCSDNTPGPQIPDLIQQIRSKVTTSAGLNPEFIIPIEPEEVPKTAIGKLQRAKLLQRLNEGELDGYLRKLDLLLQNQQTIPDWFFKSIWRKQSILTEISPKNQQNALVFLDKTGLGESLVSGLSQNGTLLRVEKGKHFHQFGPHHFSIDPAQPRNYAQLTEALANLNFWPDQIIHLWNYDPLPRGGGDFDRMETAQQWAAYSLLHLVKALHKLNPRGKSARLFMVSSRARSVLGEDQFEVEKATLGGLINTLALEAAWLNCRQVDLEPVDIHINKSLLLAELSNGDKNQEVAYRKRQRMVRGLEKVQLDKEVRKPVPVKNGGLYLITGGLGGVGSELALYLSENFDLRLILTGRTDVSQDTNSTKAQKLAKISKLNPHTSYHSCDLADFEGLTRIVEEKEKEFSTPLAGVFHLAVPDNTTRYWDDLESHKLVQEKESEFKDYFEFALHSPRRICDWLQARGDGFFVAMSSITAIFGGAGFGAYAAAHSLLTEFALDQSKKMPGRFWSPVYSSWDRLGLGENDPEFTKSLFKEKGFHHISIRQGIESLLGIMRTDLPTVICGLNGSNSNVSRFLNQVRTDSRELKVFVGLDESEGTTFGQLHLEDEFGNQVPFDVLAIDKIPRHKNGHADLQALRGLVGSQANKVGQDIAATSPIEKELVGIWSEVMGVKQVGIHDSFFEIGGHSLLAIKINARIRQAYGLDLPLNFIFKTPTIAQLAKEIEVKTTQNIDFQAQEASEISDTLDPTVREFPMTDLQQAYWVGRNNALGLGNNACQNYQEFRSSSFDLKRFNQALQKMIMRHEIMRSVVTSDGNWKVLEEIPAYQIEELDLSSLPLAEQEFSLQKVRTELSEKIYTPGKWPMFEVRVTRLNRDLIHLHLSFDLLILDNFSLGLLSREISELYNHPDKVFPSQSLTTGDYLRQIDAISSTKSYKKAEEYWQQKVETLPAAPELPLKGNYVALDSPRLSRERRLIPTETWNQLKGICQKYELTASSFLCAVYAEVLHRWSAHADFTLNVLYFNRPPLHPEVNSLIGNFSSTLLLESKREAEKSFLQRALEMRDQLWEDMAHSAVSGVAVIRAYNRRNGKAGMPSMPVTFSSIIPEKDDFQQDPGGFMDLEPVFASLQTPQVILDQKVAEDHEGRLLVHWDYLSEIFQPGVAEAMLDEFCNLLQRLADYEQLWKENLVTSLPLGQKEVMVSANDTQLPLPGGLIYSSFIENAKNTPGKLALVAGGVRISYQDLLFRASQVAQILLEQGIRNGDRVAIVMEKGWEEAVAALGILMAGGVYVPINAAFPERRIQNVIEQSGAVKILTQSRAASKLSFVKNIKHLEVDKLSGFESFTDFSPVAVDPSALAYIIFTSGSTGHPKGVMISHKAALNTLQDINQRFGIGEKDKVLGLSSLGFDLSVFDLFGLLNAGGTLVLPAPGLEKDPLHWHDLLIGEKVTVWNSVPALMQIFLEVGESEPTPLPPSLRLALLSGDWIPPRLAASLKQVAPKLSLISLGGATEASIWSIFHPIREIDPELKSIPYGKALSNQSFHVLDAELNPLPFWVPGDLYIGGVGLADGYWGDEKKTNAAFIAHPQLGRLYRTGDRGRWMPNGNIEFLGRADTQVKIQGYRIECGEIEVILETHPEIQDAVVKAFGDPMGEKQLAAFCVPKGKQLPPNAELASYLGDRLSPYMVPHRFVGLEGFPLSPNGKVDRSQLKLDFYTKKDSEVKKTHPRNSLEKALASIWAEVLEVDNPGIQDNFFELGGNSLSAMRFVGKLKKKLGLSLPLAELFKSGTIEALGQNLNLENGAAKSSSLVAIKKEGSQTPFFCVHPAGGNVLCYVGFAGMLGPDQPFYGLASPPSGIKNISIEAMAASYITEIQQVQPEGPYRIGGWSLGGIVAYEMAVQLEKQGQVVEEMVMIDSFAPTDLRNYHSVDPYSQTMVSEIVSHCHFASDLASGSDKKIPFSFAEISKIPSAKRTHFAFHSCRNNQIIPEEVSFQEFKDLFEVFDRNIRAGHDYKPCGYAGKVTLITAAETPAGLKTDSTHGWAEVVSNEVEVIKIPGNHHSIMQLPHLDKMAEEVRIKLEGKSMPSETRKRV